MITSFINGRVRLRDARFKDPEFAATAVALIKDYHGVTKVSANSNTGGLLIEYDPEKLDMEAACEALASFDPQAGEWIDDYIAASCGCCGAESAAAEPQDEASADLMANLAAKKDAIEYAAMTGAFVVCASSAFLRSKGWHIYSGLTLAGLTVQHMYKYRKRLFRHLKDLSQA